MSGITKVLKSLGKIFNPNTNQQRRQGAAGTSAEVKFGANPLYEGRAKGGENPLFEANQAYVPKATRPQVATRSVTTARKPISTTAQRSQTVAHQPKSAPAFVKTVRSDVGQEVSWPFNVQSTLNLREFE